MGVSKEDLYNAIMGASLDVILLIRPSDGRILDANPAAETTYGYSRDELLSLAVAKLRPPETRAETAAQLSAANADGIRFETTHVRKDGSRLPVEVHSRGITIGSERILVSVIRDISERIRAAEQLELYRAAVDRAPVATYWLDRVGQFVYANEAGCRALGYTRRQLLAMNVADVNSAVTRERWEQVWLALESGRSWISESVHKRSDGTEFPVELTSARFRHGEREYCNGFAIDLTDRRKAERDRDHLQAQLLQAQKLESIGRLAGGIAHDFNNILGIIVGFADLAQLSVPEDSQASADLAQVLQATRRASDLVSQIMTFARKSDTPAAPMRPSLVVKEALKFLRAALPANVEIRDTIESDALVVTEPSELQRVVMNLCTNAAQAMQDAGGILEVRLEDVAFDANDVPPALTMALGRYVCLTVRDTGSGITPENQTRIFEPFFTTKAVGEGTGMGLAVVHGIVASHGGAVTVESTVDEGSVFRAYLPMTDQPEGSTAREASVAQPGTERVLFVDNEPLLADVAARGLTRLGYQVEACTSATHAITIFREDPTRFDMVITDMDMPRVTGLALLRQVRELRTDIPTVLCTGSRHRIPDDPEVARTFDAIVSKPVSMAELTTVMRRVIEARGKAS